MLGPDASEGRTGRTLHGYLHSDKPSTRKTRASLGKSARDGTSSSGPMNSRCWPKSAGYSSRRVKNGTCVPASPATRGVFSGCRPVPYCSSVRQADMRKVRGGAARDAYSICSLRFSIELPALVLDRIASALVQCVQALQQRLELGSKVVFWCGPL